MTDASTPFDDPAGGKEEIYRATYRALLEYSYAGLSIQRIADRSSLSKSTIYHHFDSKDELLLAFAEELLLRYLEEFFVDTGEDPVGRLRRVLDLVLLGRTPEGEPLSEYAPSAIDRVYAELRAQATHDPAYRERFEEIDALVRERMAAVIREGVEADALYDVDPESVASFVYVIVEGGIYLRSTTDDDEWLIGVRKEVDRYLEQVIRDENGDSAGN